MYLTPIFGSSRYRFKDWISGFRAGRCYSKMGRSR